MTIVGTTPALEHTDEFGGSHPNAGSSTCDRAWQDELEDVGLHIESGCGISSLCVVSLTMHEKGLDGVMEVAELKTLIGDLEARVENIRDWL